MQLQPTKSDADLLAELREKWDAESNEQIVTPVRKFIVRAKSGDAIRAHMNLEPVRDEQETG